jgi:hypothetical protein
LPKTTNQPSKPEIIGGSAKPSDNYLIAYNRFGDPVSEFGMTVARGFAKPSIVII